MRFVSVLAGEQAVTELRKTQEQWAARRKEVWIMAGRRCECIQDCRAHRGRRCNQVLSLDLKMQEETGNPVMHAHHIKRRGMGGGTRDDSMENLQALCGKCHTDFHHG